MNYRAKFLHEKEKIYDFIETAVTENEGILSDEAERYLSDGLLTSYVRMSTGTIAFTVDGLYWRDENGRYIYGVLIMPVVHRSLSINEVRFKVIGHYLPDGGGSSRTDMFRKKYRVY